MNRMETIVDEYVEADESQRLHLFLAHRDFRDAFMEIDMADALRKPGRTEVRNVTGWAVRLAQYCPFWRKRCPWNFG